MLGHALILLSLDPLFILHVVVEIHENGDIEEQCHHEEENLVR